MSETNISEVVNTEEQEIDRDVEFEESVSEESVSEAEVDSEEQADAKKPGWYVVHTYSGYENKVKLNIENAIKNRHLENQILEVMIPMHEEKEMKNGVEKVFLRKVFPGYVMIHMYMNEDTWYIVRNTRGVTGFVGPDSKPVALTEQEIINMGLYDILTRVPYEVGDAVEVVSGVWKGTKAGIKEVNLQKKCVTINVELFGRETPVEIGFADVRILQ